MILLKSIKLNNFLSHSDTYFEFKDQQKIIVTGKSGSGKSSIVDSILWSIYNEGRGINKLLIKKGCSSASVSLILFDTSNHIYYNITRKIDSKNKHEVSVLVGEDLGSLEPIKTNGVRETQDYIEKNIFHASYLLFINSILYPQNSSESFIRQSANKRKDIILEIAKTEDYDSYYKKARDLFANNSNEIISLTSLIREKDYQIKENEIKSYKLSEYEQTDKDLSEKINSLILEKNKINEEKDAINKKIVLINSNKEKLKDIIDTISKNDLRVSSLVKRISELNNVDKEFLEKKIEELNLKKKERELLKEKQKEYFDWKDKVNILIQERPIDRDYNGEIEQLNKQLMDIMKLKLDSCPQCGYVNNDLKNNKEERINYLTNEIEKREELKKDADSLKNIFDRKLEELGKKEAPDRSQLILIEKEIIELEKFEKQLVEVNSFDNIKKDIEEEIQSIDKEQSQLKSKKLDIEIELKDSGLYEKMIEETLLKLKEAEIQSEELSKKRTDNYGLLILARDAIKNIEKNKEELEELKDKKTKLMIESDSLSLIKDAFSPNGIKAIVVDMLIPKLENVINNVLEKLSDSRIKFETQKSGSGKDTVLEGLFIQIINESGEELSVENLSGGESVKISSAIFEGLASISNAGFRILDESIVGLDQETILGFSEVTLQLKNNVNQLICISHIPEIQELFDEKIEVVKINGNSIIK